MLIKGSFLWWLKVITLPSSLTLGWNPINQTLLISTGEAQCFPGKVLVPGCLQGPGNPPLQMENQEHPVHIFHLNLPF